MQILKPQLGDRSRLDDDQGAFLDALLLAQENLWLFYNGFDVSDGEVREPSSVLQELINHIALIAQSETALSRE
jgi:exodeoxyribonuclease V gamma subunit